MRPIEVHVTRYADRRNLVLWWRDPITDKVRSHTAGTHIERDAQRAAARLEAELAAGTFSNGVTSWEQFVEAVEADKFVGLSENTVLGYRATINSVTKHLDPSLLSVFSRPATITQYVAALRKDGLAETSIQTYLKQLRILLTWATRQNMLHQVPAFPTLRTGQRNSVMRGRPITGEEFDRLIATVPTVRQLVAKQWTRYLTGLWWSGLRLAESLRVSWDQDAEFCVDFTSTRPAFRIYAEGQKSRQDQLHPMAPEFSEFITANWPATARRGPLFQLRHHSTNRPLAANEVGRIVRTIGRKAGIIVSKTPKLKHASCHDLRRSFGTRWAKRVRPIVLQQMMRHKDIKTTMDHYIYHDLDDLAGEIWATLHPESTDYSTLKPVATHPTNKKRP